MRVSRQQAAANRERVLDVAAALFRVHGFNGVSIADVMRTSGLTHGGFYGQFDSKEALIEECCSRGVQDSVAEVRRERTSPIGPAAPGVLGEVLDDYVSASHRDNPQSRCTVAALANDAGRAPTELQSVFASGVTGMAQALGASSSRASSQDDHPTPDYFLLAGMVGAIVLSRAVRDADPALSDRILKDTRDGLVAADSR
ncbi:TetR/AcrR family transcriptional regulator [Streptomyces sp. NPDC127119]|uniref:TetR/AcrR family transcriptional regulator n=1 Tax=Streptomyces sp. NPDC127119 TaxID=3345370 RepID=UPI0036380452